MNDMLKNLLSKIVAAAIAIGERRLQKTENALLKRALLFFIDSGKKVILALLDDDKDNNAQLHQIVKLQAVQGVNIASEFGRERVLLFQDKKLAAAIIQFIGGTEEMFKSLLDENPDNEAQIVEIWKRRKLLLLGDGMDILTDKLADLIRKKVGDPILAGIIIEILQSLDDLVKEPSI